MIGIMFAGLHQIWEYRARAIQLKAGAALFRAGDPIVSLYQVSSGEMRLVRSLSHGADLTLQRAKEGAILAEASVFATAYHCGAVAATPTLLMVAPVERAREMLDGDPELMRAFARHLALEVQGARTRAEIVSLKTVAARLDAWFATYGERLPARGRWREVADELGVSPPALYRELARRRNGVV